LRVNLNWPLARWCVALFLSFAAPGVAHAQVSLACWTFEFVPGERVYQTRLGNVQRGRTFFSKEFTDDGLNRLTIAEAFETHVRATTPPLSSKSQYVAGCTGSSPAGGAEGNAMRGHQRFLNEGAGYVTSVVWAPSAADRAAARLADNKSPVVYMQCVLATDTDPYGGQERYDRPYQVVRTRVFMAEARGGASEQLGNWGRANGITINDNRCFAASTPERLKAEYADARDHYGPASQTREIDFIPDFAHLPGAAPKVAAAPKPAPPKPVPAKPVSPGVLIVEDNGIAARTKAWEDTVLEAQRQDAAIRAKQVAETARSSAEHKAVLAKVFEEMRKRGNKQ
jgi:hypothetical protein